MSGSCHECGEHRLDCKCDKNEKCSKCDKIRMRWDSLCFHCVINEGKKLIKKAQETIDRIENENDKCV